MNSMQTFGAVVCVFFAVSSVSARRMVRPTEDISKMKSHLGDAGKTEAKTHPYGDDVMNVMDACNVTNPIPAEFLMEFNSTGELPDNATKSSKCYVHCVFMNIKLMDDMGNFNAENVGKFFKKHTTEEGGENENFEKCFSAEKKTSTDICEKSYDRISCLLKEVIKSDSGNDKGAEGMEGVKNK